MKGSTEEGDEMTDWLNDAETPYYILLAKNYDHWDKCPQCQQANEQFQLSPSIEAGRVRQTMLCPEGASLWIALGHAAKQAGKIA